MTVQPSTHCLLCLKIPPATRSLSQLARQCSCLLKTGMAAWGSSRPSQTGKSTQFSSGTSGFACCSFVAIRFRNQTENWLKSNRRPLHALSLRGLSFCAANLDLGCLPKGQTPPDQGPTTILSTCISEAEPNSRSWLWNSLLLQGYET